MRVISNIAKTIQVLLIAILIFCYNVDLALARGGCFLGNAKILAPSGDKSIADLRPGDRIIGYNFDARRTEVEKIGKIEVIRSPDYYRINESIEVTGTHPFYVKTSTKTSIVEVRQLSPNDILLGKGNSDIVISKIEHINQPANVYNLISVTPNHNFYANGVLVHNKGGGGGHGGGGGGGGHSGGFYGSGYKGEPIDTLASLASLMLCFTVMIAAFIPVAFYQEISNSIRFFGKSFTEDTELINFTKSIVPVFKNCYSFSYSKDDERWGLSMTRIELDELSYQQFITKADLISSIDRMFIKYQDDWTRKKFASISEYTNLEFDKKQRQIFRNSFGDNFDIVYHQKIINIIPLTYREENDRYIFQVQIDAEMINFSVDIFGAVLSGENYLRSFTEYWDVEVDLDRKCYLAGIYNYYEQSLQTA
jgi:hypothetical protein